MNESSIIAVSSLIYTILLMIVYFYKKRLSRLENKIYISIMVTTFISIILFLITFIKAFIWFFIIIFIFIAIITVPIWGIPYSLYYIFRKSYNKELI